MVGEAVDCLPVQSQARLRQSDTLKQTHLRLPTADYERRPRRITSKVTRGGLREVVSSNKCGC